MDGLYLEITDIETLVEIADIVKKKSGLLKDISKEKLEESLSKQDFPIRIPVMADKIIGYVGNPVLKGLFGKKLETAVMNYLTKVEG